MDPDVVVEKQPAPYWASKTEPLGLRPVWKHFRFPKYMVEVYNDNENYFSGRHGVAHHYQRSQSEWEPCERGGYSFCYLYNDDGQVVATGHADCSHKDHFSYRRGCQISLGRALHKYNGRAITPA